MKKSQLTQIIREELNNVMESPASNMLGLLSAPEFIKAKDALTDKISPSDFDKINKLYTLLYSELKKHE